MGFLSFSLRYYQDRIQEYEKSPLTETQQYEARQLLKMLDDLLDEGYTSLCEEMEAQFQGVSRLRAVLKENQLEPFPMPEHLDRQVVYEDEESEIAALIDDVVNQATDSEQCDEKPFLRELREFIRWIGYEENTAYIFLLRDTLLPYIWFKDQKRKNVHPWLLGRKTMDFLTGEEYVDDDLRAAFFEALEQGVSGFESFREFVKPQMCAVLAEYPQAEKGIKGLLSKIEADRIVVVESGCYGTFPMLLAALDQRVDIRMFTAVPYMLEIYGERIFTTAYEKNRLFETLYSQDQLMRFARFEDGKFYVQVTADASVIDSSLAEIKTILQGDC